MLTWAGKEWNRVQLSGKKSRIGGRHVWNWGIDYNDDGIEKFAIRPAASSCN